MTDIKQITPPYNTKTVRSSNLELYRIIVMLLIVAHHYVVNSGLMDMIAENPLTPTGITMLLFGAWGKTGINCFVMITGWFMCKSRFSWQKLLRLYVQITVYAVAIYGIFCLTGHQSFHPVTAALKFFPVKSLSDGFVSCFLVFYLLVPFLNILVENMNKRSHATLLVILLTVFTILPTFPAFGLRFNYVEWFCTLYFVASYIRMHGLPVKLSHAGWGWVTFLLLLTASTSIIGMTALSATGRMGAFAPYFFVSDSNKILAFMLGVSSFMYFKDLRISSSHIINTIGATTFGVLLIHANSDTMREWLWRQTVDCTGHLTASPLHTLIYATLSVILVFAICSLIDYMRLQLFKLNRRNIPFLTKLSN